VKLFNSRLMIAVLAVLVLGGTLAACGGSSDSSPETSSNTSEAESKGGADSASAALKSAEEFVQPLTEHPSPFPVTEPLKELPPDGTTIDFLELPNPVAAIEWVQIQEAAQAMGVNVKRVRAGEGAQGISSAMDTIVSEKPDGVVIVAVDPVQISTQLKELQEANIPIASSSISTPDAEKYGLEHISYGHDDAKLAGELDMAWLFANSEGKNKNYVFYSLPEFAFSVPNEEGAKAKLAELCPDCELRVVPIKASELGNKAPATIVSDLQAHPETEASVLSADSIQEGLPVALNAAGLELEALGPGPIPQNILQIQEGTQTAALGIDLGTQIWTLVDQIAREIAEQKQTGAEARGEIVKQFLTHENAKEQDASKGFLPYPEFEERFTKLWHGEPWPGGK